MEHSPLLQAIIKEARCMCGAVLSAEAFMLAVARNLAGMGTADRSDPELLEVESYFADELMDIHIMAEAILRDVTGAGCCLPEQSGYYMESSMFRAETRAMSDDRDFLTVPDVVCGILSSPSEAFMRYKT